MDKWKEERNAALNKTTEKLQELVGKTILSISMEPHDDDCDGENLMLVSFTDGSLWHFVGGYGGYTGNSCDEYIEFLTAHKIDTSNPNKEVTE